jgi:hypothetical protein
MPGMNTGLNVSDPTAVAAFKTALLHQGLIALLIFLLVGLAWLSPPQRSGQRPRPRPSRPDGSCPGTGSL